MHQYGTLNEPLRRASSLSSRPSNSDIRRREENDPNAARNTALSSLAGFVMGGVIGGVIAGQMTSMGSSGVTANITSNHTNSTSENFAENMKDNVAIGLAFGSMLGSVIAYVFCKFAVDFSKKQMPNQDDFGRRSSNLSSKSSELSNRSTNDNRQIKRVESGDTEVDSDGIGETTTPRNRNYTLSPTDENTPQSTREE